ncbi:hypothetical protein MPLSOD_180013 [Mesorhizobium sp. SOD10]|nr:hypothetical protein MPLSOD_180013 [Mesorhizobium sp. SOD10]
MQQLAECAATKSVGSMTPWLLCILGYNLSHICAIERLMIHVWPPNFIGGRFEKFYGRQVRPAS